VAGAIARAVGSFDPSLVLFGPPGTELLRAGRSAGLAVAGEGFADRAYESDGSLTPRNESNAIVHDPVEVVARALRMVRDGVVVARDGSTIPMCVETICTHGDTIGSAELTRRLRAGLEQAGIRVRPIQRGS
jgi:UPF0271 protein